MENNIPKGKVEKQRSGFRRDADLYESVEFKTSKSGYGYKPGQNFHGKGKMEGYKHKICS